MSRLIFSELGTTPSDTDSGASQIYVKDDGSLYLKRGSSAEGIIGSNWTVTGNDIYYNTGNVGIGRTDPDANLHVVGSSGHILRVESTDAGSGSGPYLTLHRNSASPADGDVLGHISFSGDTDTGAEVSFAYIQTQAEDVSNGTQDGALVLGTVANGSGAERLRITSTGNVGIGTQTPEGLLHIKHATNSTELSANHIFGISTGGISISAVPIAKAWVTYEGKNNTGIVGGQSYNVSSVTNPSGTLNQVNFATDMPSADYVVVATLTRGQTWNGDIGVEYLTQTASSVRFQAGNSGGAFGSTEHEISVVIYAL